MGLFSEVLENVGKPFNTNSGFSYGTHEVVIGTAEAKSKDTKNTKGAAIIEVVVFDEADNERSATCTLWFHTEGAAKMSVTKVLGMLVHSVGEEKKDKVRELGKKLFGAIEEPAKARDVAAKLMTEKLVGKKAYLVAEPNGKYKTTSYGDLWHYPAEPQNADIHAVGEVEDVDMGSDTDELTEADLPNFEGDDL